MATKKREIKVQHDMGEGDPPAAVRVTVEQGPHTLQAADVAPGADAEFAVDDGDYTVRAQSLVPAGAAASTTVAVPGRVTATVKG